MSNTVDFKTEFLQRRLLARKELVCELREARNQLAAIILHMYPRREDRAEECRSIYEELLFLTMEGDDNGLPSTPPSSTKD